MSRLFRSLILFFVVSLPVTHAQATEKLSIYYDVTRSSKMGIQTEYLFSQMKGTRSTLPTKARKKRTRHFTIKVKDFGIPLFRKTKITTKLQTMKVNAGRYVWQNFSMGNGNYNKVYNQPTGLYRIKLEEGQNYYLGEFKIVEGMLSGEVAYWTPGNLERAIEACRARKSKKSTTQRKSELQTNSCDLIPALVSKEPIMGQFQRTFDMTP